MSVQQLSTAAAVAQAHVEAWGRHDYDAARAALAEDVHVTVTTVDPMPPAIDTVGIDAYMRGLQEFGQVVVAGASEVTAAYGDETRALLHVKSRVRMAPDAPEMTLRGARLYELDAEQRIRQEQVIFFVSESEA